MPIVTPTHLLVRHGEYERLRPNNLTETGKLQAEHARDWLVATGIGNRALVLASTTPRGLETAGIIASGLGVEVVESKYANFGGQHARGIEDLDAFIDKALADADAALDDDQRLVMVTHAPLIAIAKHEQVSRCEEVVHNGEVFEYIPGSWQNPSFTEHEQRLMEAYLDGVI